MYFSSSTQTQKLRKIEDIKNS